jgi:hypothetical protein
MAASAKVEAAAEKESCLDTVNQVGVLGISCNAANSD